MTTFCLPEHVLHQQYLKIQQLNSAAARLEHEASNMRVLALQLEVILDHMKVGHGHTNEAKEETSIF
jgi:hypothetical protein